MGSHNISKYEQLSAEKFIGRACTLLIILFCLITIVGYLQMPFDIPTHLINGIPGKYMSKNIVFMVPAIGVALYMLISYIENYMKKPGKKFKVGRKIAYYNSLARVTGISKLLVLFTGIIITTELIHSALNSTVENDWGYQYLPAILIAIPFIFMMNEVIKVRKTLTTKN